MRTHPSLPESLNIAVPCKGWQSHEVLSYGRGGLLKWTKVYLSISQLRAKTTTMQISDNTWKHFVITCEAEGREVWGCHLVHWVQAKDTHEHLNVAGRPHTRMNYPAPNVNRAAVETSSSSFPLLVSAVKNLWEILAITTLHLETWNCL